MNFERKLVLHPAVSPELQALIDKLPPPETITIEIPAFYADAAIPWQTRPPDMHYLAVTGRPDGADTSIVCPALRTRRRSPVNPREHLDTSRPSPQNTATPETVIAEVQSSLHPPGAFYPSQGIAAWTDLQREIYGSLTPPWDAAPGQFNQHDRAALARFARDMPALSGLVGHYLQIHNVLDEFDRPFRLRGCSSTSTSRSVTTHWRRFLICTPSIAIS